MTQNLPVYAWKQPFGEATSETEVKYLRKTYDEDRYILRYADYYVTETPIHSAAKLESTYLIVGRRGTGKTSLAQFFSTESRSYIDIDEPADYEQVLTRIQKRTTDLSDDFQIEQYARLWENLIWAMLFDLFHGRSTGASTAITTLIGPIYRARRFGYDKSVIVNAFFRVIKAKLSQYAGPEAIDTLEAWVGESVLAPAKEAVLQMTRKEPVTIAIDTLDRYDISNGPIMKGAAALIMSANKFNLDYASSGIHVKAFMSSEIFPTIREKIIPHTTRHIRNTVYIDWAPIDLARLAVRRLYLFLLAKNLVAKRVNSPSQHLDQSMSLGKIIEIGWNPYLGLSIPNGEVKEASFSYVLRHTQLVPRQLIILCNQIAEISLQKKTFPQMAQVDIPQIVADTTPKLASESINAYSKIYEYLDSIMDSLKGLPPVFSGEILHNKAQTAVDDSSGAFTISEYFRAVAELNIIGIVRSLNTFETNSKKKFDTVCADFEYHLKGRLRMNISLNDRCVIHPMFYSRIMSRSIQQPIIVFPFPDNDEFLELQNMSLL